MASLRDTCAELRIRLIASFLRPSLAEVIGNSLDIWPDCSSPGGTPGHGGVAGLPTTGIRYELADPRIGRALDGLLAWFSR